MSAPNVLLNANGSLQNPVFHLELLYFSLELINGLFMQLQHPSLSVSSLLYLVSEVLLQVFAHTDITFLLLRKKLKRLYKKSLGHNKMIASKRRTIAVPIFLVCLNTFVPLRYGHSLSAGRNLSFLAALRDLSFPSLSRRSRVSYAPFHPVSNIVFTINQKT